MDTADIYKELIAKIKDHSKTQMESEELLNKLGNDTIKLYSVVYFEYRKNEISRINDIYNYSIDLDDDSHNAVVNSLSKLDNYCDKAISTICNRNLEENIKLLSASKILDLNYKDLEEVRRLLNRELYSTERKTVDYLPTNEEKLFDFSQKISILERSYFKDKDNFSAINLINTIDEAEKPKSKVKIKPH